MLFTFHDEPPPILSLKNIMFKEKVYSEPNIWIIWSKINT